MADRLHVLAMVLAFFVLMGIAGSVDYASEKMENDQAAHMRSEGR